MYMRLTSVGVCVWVCVFECEWLVLIHDMTNINVMNIKMKIEWSDELQQQHQTAQQFDTLLLYHELVFLLD